MILKWGIISTANIAVTQLIPAILRSENSEVVAIASRGAKVHAVAEQFGIEHAYESYEELLADEFVDAVYIPLPNDLHVEWAIKAAQAGKHILCEKPIALNVKEFEQLQQVCEKHGVYMTEAFMYQFHPQYRYVKEALANGEIGDVKLYRSSHSFFLEDRESNIRMDATKGGGAIWDVGCYSLHALQQLIPSEMKSVFTMSKFDEKTGIDLTSNIVATLENGVVAVIDCSFDMTARNEITIVGSKGTITLAHAFRPDFAGHLGKVIVKTGLQERSILVDGDIYRLEIEFFEQVVAGQQSIAEQHRWTKRNIELIDAAYRSAKMMQPVVFKENKR